MSTWEHLATLSLLWRRNSGDWKTKALRWWDGLEASSRTRLMSNRRQWLFDRQACGYSSMALGEKEVRLGGDSMCNLLTFVQDGATQDLSARTKVVDWVTKTHQCLSKMSSVTLQGMPTVDTNVEPVTDEKPSMWGPNLQRLRAVKKKYDPRNIFNVNHNIPPL